MADPFLSINRVPIRLTDERWAHIIEEHPEIAPFRDQIAVALSSPERVLQGNFNELFAVRMIELQKALVVVYREVSTDDGFVITAFLTRRLRSLARRIQLWPPQQ
jgi:hypothetical protein